jgi:hypothetical protein
MTTNFTSPLNSYDNKKIQSTLLSYSKYASGSFLPWKEGNFILIASKSPSKSSCDTVQPCDTTQVRSNSDFSVKSATVQVYGNSYNSDMLSYYGLRFQVNRSLGRHHNTGQQRLYEFCYLLPFNLWTSYLVRILFLQGCGSWLWEFPSSTRIFNELQYNLQVWQGFINVSESFSYNDSLFILATQGKKGWWYLMTN